jgi:hypothetical protein
MKLYWREISRMVATPKIKHVESLMDQPVLLNCSVRLVTGLVEATEVMLHATLVSSFTHTISELLSKRHMLRFCV